MSDICRVPPGEVAQIVAEILVAHGVRASDARQQADLWVEGDRRGQPSHGVHRLFTMLGRIRGGVVNVNSDPSFTWSAPGVLEVDGDDGLGPPTAMAALDELDAVVASQGIVIALLHRTHHLGMLAPYVEYLANRGLIGVATCTSEALVHPWGGFQPLVGTNPLAIAVPVDSSEVVTVDMSTGATSRGRVLHHAHIDEPLEPGWAVDAQGVPTLDAAEAVTGAISPFGGPKGYALGLALEVLVASLTGTAFGNEVTGTLDEISPVTKGDVFIVIDPQRTSRNGPGGSGAAYLEAIRSATPAPGFDKVMVPGDRAQRVRSSNDEAGIPLDADLWKRIQRTYEANRGT